MNLNDNLTASSSPHTLIVTSLFNVWTTTPVLLSNSLRIRVKVITRVVVRDSVRIQFELFKCVFVYRVSLWPLIFEVDFKNQE